ncbi:hypothetical protein ACXR2U_11085 [Jatrophihabitans sp. YIM 134969]
MTGLACWLVVVGLVDLARSGRVVRGTVRTVALGAPALVLLALTAFAAGPHGAVGVTAWVVGGLALVAWLVGAADGWAPSGAAPLRASRLAFGGFAVGVVAFAVAGARAGDPGVLDGLVRSSVLAGRVTSEQAALVAAVVLVQFGTANLLVRLLLDRVGVPAPDNEKRLRGGRFLGPMERLLIVGLGLAGSLGGAAVVVAAKALLRFPELREARRGDPGGPSDVTEYFLVGSFASWIVAFGSLALAAL